MHTPKHRVCIAPMMNCTDRHQRYFMRMITRRAVLYTEMLTTAAILHGDSLRLLRFDSCEHPLALQLGGSDPSAMAACARLGEDAGYDEININVGCPSARVAAGRFGACLMAEPDTVADCVAAMRATVDLPVSVKTRIGIDRDESLQRLYRLVETCAAAGVETFIVHARNAWLKGLSPRQNREVPPLRYAVVYGLKRDFPNLEIVINGGIRDLAAMQAHLQQVDGVMLGREAYANPYLLAQVDTAFFGDDPAARQRAEVLENYLPYVARQLDEGTSLGHIARHIAGLYQGLPGARAWRRELLEGARRPGAGTATVRAAASRVRDAGGTT